MAAHRDGDEFETSHHRIQNWITIMIKSFKLNYFIFLYRIKLKFKAELNFVFGQHYEPCCILIQYKSIW